VLISEDIPQLISRFSRVDLVRTDPNSKNDDNHIMNVVCEIEICYFSGDYTIIYFSVDTLV